MVDAAIDIDDLTDEEQAELLALLEEEDEYCRTHLLYEYSP